MSSIGREIKRLRGEKGWSQAELAVYAGSSQPTVNQIESGKRNPSTRTLEKLADALGVEVASFFPKDQESLPFEENASPLSLEDLEEFLQERVGSSRIALPEEGWKNWWRGVRKEEALERYQQIRSEWGILKQEWLATQGKVEAEPRLVPRGRQWGEVYFTLFARSFEASFHAPQKTESEEEFQLRSSEGRAIDAFYKDPVQQQHEEEKHTLRILAKTPA